MIVLVLAHQTRSCHRGLNDTQLLDLYEYDFDRGPRANAGGISTLWCSQSSFQMFHFPCPQLFIICNDAEAPVVDRSKPEGAPVSGREDGDAEMRHLGGVTP